MLCKSPYMMGNVPFGCGQCVPCRVNRRRQWMWRQVLESFCHEENSFVTLTYDDKSLPSDGSLRPKDVQVFLKRFRWHLSPRRIRYFLVGEYGERGMRPHYHLSVFGVSGHTLVARASGPVLVERLVAESWGHGFVQVAEFNELTAQYVAGYVVKKMTRAGDVRLKGLHPEFARMSRRPGLGHGAMGIVADALCRRLDGLEDSVLPNGDVPSQLQIGKRSIPLGRYLLRSLRQAVGFTDEYIEELKRMSFHERSVEMSALLQAALVNAPLSSSRSVYLQEVKQKILNVEARSKLWKKKETL